GVALTLAEPPGEWPFRCEVVFVIGTGLTLITFAFLRRSFAVLPSLREVVDRGPYRLVRHPAYAGELLMVVGCAATASPPVTLLLVTVACVGTVFRIHAEE